MLAPVDVPFFCLVQLVNEAEDPSKKVGVAVSVWGLLHPHRNVTFWCCPGCTVLVCNQSKFLGQQDGAVVGVFWPRPASSPLSILNAHFQLHPYMMGIFYLMDVFHVAPPAPILFILRLRFQYQWLP